MDLKTKAENLKIGKLTHHIFVCADQTNPKCCDKEESIKIWEYLKNRIDALNLDNNDVQVFRSKTHCLRLCAEGPVAVIYPQGVWYHSLTREVVDLIIDEHIINGNIVEEYVVKKTSFKV